MARDRKKTGKFRGTRRQGKGNIKNRSGNGHRGGVGKSGLKKHLKSWVTKYEPDHFGKFGFFRKKPESPTINLYEIERKIVKGELKQEGSKYLFEFKGKILGSGFVNYPLKLKAKSWSKGVEEKIKKVSGEISLLE